MAISRLVIALVLGLVLLHPPLTLGLAFGPEGRRWGQAIEASLGTDRAREALIGMK